MVRRLSIIAIILAAAVLAYGFVDAWSYRAGYTAGSIRISRLVGVACEKGLVDDESLCESSEGVLYPLPPSAVMGLAQVAAITEGGASSVSAATLTTAQRRAARAARRAARLPQSSVIAPADGSVGELSSVSGDVSVLPAEPATPMAPSVSPATQQIIGRVSAAQALPADNCSKRTNLECSAGNFDCAINQATYKCDFNATVAGLRAIPADNIVQSAACLTPTVIDRLGVGAFIEGSQVSVCANAATGRFVYLSMPADVRPLAELLLNADPALKAFAKSAGASVITVTQSATPVLESCMARGQRLYVPGQPMPSMLPGIDCAMDYGMMPMSQSSVYTPSTLAQLISILVTLFR